MNLLDVTPKEAERLLHDWVVSADLPRYRARQILPRLWQRPVANWEDCTDLPKELIKKLNSEFPISRPELAASRESKDGTVKYLWRFPDGALVEAVKIPDGTRQTICISSQVGCAFGCVFCATGKMGFKRNLSPWEITAQVRELLLVEDPNRQTNVVFMGMGEPLHNWPAVDTALTILNDERGLRIGARRITVSTVGIVPGIRKLAARKEQFRLALSLHTPFSETRRALMPVERKHPIADVLHALEVFPRRLTIEYVVISGENDRAADADELAKIAEPLGAFVNLLQLHPGGASDLAPSSAAAVRAFASKLRKLGVNTNIRRSRGLDIDAACGQLWVRATGGGKITTEQDSDVE